MKLTDLNNKIANYGSIYLTADFEHFFNIYEDKNKNYVYNLNTNLYFNVPDTALLTCIILHDSHWPLISYKLYKTTHLAWLLMKLNKIEGTRMFDIIHSGETIKYLPEQNVQEILNLIY